MKIIISPDSFKGSYSAIEVANCIEGVIRSLDSTADITTIPVADGGEGTIDAITACVNATIYEVEVKNPIGKPVVAKYAMLEEEKIAVIEMAQASGLPLLSLEERNPMLTTTYGTGQLMKDALDKGCKKMIIGIGGSATNDGGAGMLMALGASLRDKNGAELALGGGALSELASVDMEKFDKRIADIEVVVACDVSNPLIGENGASYVYGPQKGATPEMVKKLDGALENLAKVSQEILGQNLALCPGAGAAGGLGFALMAFCNAKFASGIDIVLDVCGFEKELSNASLVITGEGRIDGQSINGKVLYGIGMRAKRHKVPVIAFGGAVMTDAENLTECGITAMFSIANGPITLEYAMGHTKELLEQSVRNVMRVYLQK